MLSPRSPRIVCTTNCTSASTTPRSSFTHSTTRREASENRGIYYYCFHYYFSAVFHDLNFKFFLFLFSVRLWPFTFTYYLFLFLFAASAALSLILSPISPSHISTTILQINSQQHGSMRLAVSPFLFIFFFFFFFFCCFLFI